jgi:hypothetical protein
VRGGRGRGRAEAAPVRGSQRVARCARQRLAAVKQWSTCGKANRVFQETCVCDKIEGNEGDGRQEGSGCQEGPSKEKGRGRVEDRRRVR